MRPILSVAALVAGICLVYMGYERQGSLAGKADKTLSRIGQKIDGGDHTPAQVKYYIAGTVLAIGGAVGLGLVKR
jgi:drug/metabolite transporter (DMT)-like permease